MKIITLIHGCKNPNKHENAKDREATLGTHDILDKGKKGGGVGRGLRFQKPKRVVENEGTHKAGDSSR